MACCDYHTCNMNSIVYLAKLFSKITTYNMEEEEDGRMEEILTGMAR